MAPSLKSPEFDPGVAQQMFTFSRYCANGLIAGGGAAALWCILGSVVIDAQSNIALHVLFYALLFGGAVFMLSGMRFGGFDPRWSAYVLPLVFLLAGAWSVGNEIAYQSMRARIHLYWVAIRLISPRQERRFV